MKKYKFLPEIIVKDIAVRCGHMKHVIFNCLNFGSVMLSGFAHPSFH